MEKQTRTRVQQFKYALIMVALYGGGSYFSIALYGAIGRGLFG